MSSDYLIANDSNKLLINHVFAYFIAFLGFYLFSQIVYITLKKPGLGGGDTKLFAMAGAWLGLSGLEVTIVLAFLFGGIFSLIGLSTNLIKRGNYIPFGPFICLSICFVWLLGSDFWFNSLGNIFWWRYI